MRQGVRFAVHAKGYTGWRGGDKIRVALGLPRVNKMGGFHASVGTRKGTGDGAQPVGVGPAVRHLVF